jgi:hypothetical protein
MSRHLITKVFISSVLALGSSWALASGSEAGGSAQTGDMAMYNAGKGVYATKFACGDCPLAGKPLNAELARGLLDKKPAAQLSADESAALTVYLKRRFKL